MIKHGDVLHCYSNGILARLIRLFTRSRVNHTAIAVELLGKLYVIDSQLDGTNLRPYEEWLAKYNYDFIVDRPKEFTDEHFAKAMSVIGTTPYDFKSLLWYQPKYILTGKWSGHRYDEAKERLYCSEYVAWIFDLPKWWKASPEAVKQYMRKSNKFERVQS